MMEMPSFGLMICAMPHEMMNDFKFYTRRHMNREMLIAAVAPY